MSLWRTSVFEKCRDTGVYGLIIPDLPYELSQRLKQQFSHYGVKIISLVAMTTDDKRIKDIVSHAEGFIYTVTMNATTGQNGAFHPELKRKIESIKAIANVPVVAGFGIRTPQHVADIKEVADGIVIKVAKSLSDLNLTRVRKSLNIYNLSNKH